MGVHEGPPPSDIGGVYGIPIGSSGAARYAEAVSHVAAELEHVINRYVTIEKYAPPWPKDW
jgi:hypothetical protein